MSLLTDLRRLAFAVPTWLLVVYPGVAIVQMLVLPPDPITQLSLFGGAVMLAVGAAAATSYALPTLRRFAIAAFVVALAVLLPVTALFRVSVYAEFLSLAATLTSLALIAVVYGVAYYLVYEDGYTGLKSRSGIGD